MPSKPRLTAREVERLHQESQQAIQALRDAAKAHGYLVKEVESRRVHICYTTGNPFYTVQIVRRPRAHLKKLYYDIGECFVLDADKAIVKIIERMPK